MNYFLKISTIIIICFATYYWLNTDANKFDKSEAIFSCNFIEQFVEIYKMDKVCNKTFKGGRISNSEYWTSSLETKKITRIWYKKQKMEKVENNRKA
jgi:hypothetical protein